MEDDVENLKIKIEEKLKELKTKLNSDDKLRIYTLKDSYELQIAILEEILNERRNKYV